MKVIGITGSIASGKSEASKYIRSKGFNIVDADSISRDITRKGNIGYRALIETFGDILDSRGNIDRKYLSKLVFNDKDKLKMLNSILHPLIFDEIDAQIEKYNKENFIFLDVPLLFETNLDKKCNDVILLCCDEDIQLDRIIKRDKISIEEAKLIIDNQMPVLKKKKKSGFVVENNETLEILYSKLDIIIDILKNKVL